MRLSGILMPIDSLPNNSGISTLSDAVRFVRFLKKAEQSFWQVTSVVAKDRFYSDSHVQSVFATDCTLIDIDKLQDQGLIPDKTDNNFSQVSLNKDVGSLENRENLLKVAFENFYRENPPKEFTDFLSENKYWLEDFAFYSALKKHFNGLPWYEWPEDIRNRNSDAINHYQELLSKSIEYERFCQYEFFIQWHEMQQVLKNNNVNIIGEVPLLCEYDSVDVWANRQLFLLKPNAQPRRRVVLSSRYCKDRITTTYIPFNWQAMRAERYQWWEQRISHYSKMYDALVVDNFYCLNACYAVQWDKDTNHGMWLKGAGKTIVDLFAKVAPQLKLVAGSTVPRKKSVANFATNCGISQCRSMQQLFKKFGHNSKFNVGKEYFAYVCDKKNGDSARSWWSKTPWLFRAKLRKFLNITKKTDINWQIIETLLVSDAQVSIIAMKDLKQSGLPTDKTQEVVFCDSDFSNAVAKRLAQLTEKASRSPQPSDEGSVTENIHNTNTQG